MGQHKHTKKLFEHPADDTNADDVFLPGHRIMVQIRSQVKNSLFVGRAMPAMRRPETLWRA